MMFHRNMDKEITTTMTSEYKTGPVDPLRPLELDDGTPCVVREVREHSVEVEFLRPVNPTRGDAGHSSQGSWHYYLDSGLWCGGDEFHYKVLRNVAEEQLLLDLDLPMDGERAVHLPEDEELRREMPLFDGFMAYFPNAMAEVARLSYLATQQHHPEKGMHWDRSKSTDHLNKIGRHMIDVGKFDDRGQRHSTMLAWRAMANLQEELERDLGLPPSPASRNRPF